MNKKFKIVLALMLALCMTGVFAACTSNPATNEPTTAPTEAPTSEPTATPEPTATAEPTPTATPEPTPTEVPVTPAPTALPEGFPVADIFSANFTIDGMEDVSGNDYEIKAVGTPLTVYNEKLGRYVMDCQGGMPGDEDAGNFSVFGYEKYYDSMLSSFTWETYAMYYEAYQEMYIMSNLHAGGFAIGVPEGSNDSSDDSTSYMVLMRDNAIGSYAEPKLCDGAENVWVHVTATWDGSDLTLYVNGEQVSKNAISQFAWTTEPGAKYLTIGSDTSAEQLGEYFWYGQIARCNIYSKCLTADEVTMVYQAATAVAK